MVPIHPPLISYKLIKTNPPFFFIYSKGLKLYGRNCHPFTDFPKKTIQHSTHGQSRLSFLKYTQNKQHGFNTKNGPTFIPRILPIFPTQIISNSTQLTPSNHTLNFLGPTIPQTYINIYHNPHSQQFKKLKTITTHFLIHSHSKKAQPKPEIPFSF